MESLHQRWLARASSDTTRILGEPLVSIICFCKDRAPTIRRCVESVLGQTYKNIEFVVQDGASTDGTVEILRSYDDPRIKLVSEKDSGPAEACWKALQRCEGDIIGICLSDEELLPDAVARAVGHFRAAPHLGALTCDGLITNLQGEIINEFNAGDFNIVDYLFGWYCPFWPGSFFRRQALLEIGLKSDKWTIECLEFETWCRLATRHEVKYIPERMSKYSVHETQLSQTRQYFHEHFDNRARVIRRMFSGDGFFGENEAFLFGCLYNQLYLLYNHVRAYKLGDQVELLRNLLRSLLEEIGIVNRIRYKAYFDLVPEGSTSSRWSRGKSVNALLPYHKASSIWLRIALAIPAGIRQRISRRAKDFLRAAVHVAVDSAYNLRRILRGVRDGFRRKLSQPTEQNPPSIDFSPLLYHEVAKIYYARGQVEQALQLWRKAEPLASPTVDALACQAMLMSPSATYPRLLAMQQRWAERHAKPLPELASHAWPAYDGKRRIRVGYFCSFLDSDTIRYIMTQVIRHRERERFEVIGYSPSPVPSDIADTFDDLRIIGMLPDERFVQLVRADEVDVFVEMSGLSPFNRFAAMASRCAPIQISYLNHTGTTAVPNVDYVFADEVSVLPPEDRYFTEKVWRLPGSFLCYDYDGAQLPDVAETPCRANGNVTFGCFGSGGKIGTQVIALWAEIMKQVPDSIFFLRNPQLNAPDNRQFMQERFARFGIPPERLRILGGTDRAGILESYGEVDISLDTWPYCGGNTIAEPICQGVPVITLKGERFSGRYGASLVIAAGCPELVADSADQYVDIAVKLARSAERLDYYRKNLRRMAREHGLSDAERFARKLEAAYIEMMRLRWNAADENQAPR